MMVSGGACWAKFHFGTLKCLGEADLLPNVIVGTSAGSVICAGMAMLKRTELKKFETFDMLQARDQIVLTANSVFGAIKTFLAGDPLGDIEAIKNFVRNLTADYTFKDVHDINGWELCITVTDSRNADNQRLLNYITDPDVTIWSAVCASCSIPEFFGTQKLYTKNPTTGQIEEYYSPEIQTGLDGKARFVDGSISCDIPTKRVSELFGVNTFIVS